MSWNFSDVEYRYYCDRHAPRERVSWNLIVANVIYSWSGHAPRERVSWNLIQFSEFLGYQVTLHVSVWVEMRTRWRHIILITSHAPRERVSWNCKDVDFDAEDFKSRSTWACELKFYVLAFYQMPLCHAPRERVSWNCCQNIPELRLIVTLHVSVWVEISSLTSAVRIFQRSRSTWACELKCSIHSANLGKSESRSTWACELKLNLPFTPTQNTQSRSTWACELKSILMPKMT